MATPGKYRKGFIQLNTKLVVRDFEALLKRLDGFNEKTIAELQRDTRRFHNNVRRRTRVTAPRKTGYMARNVESRYSQNGLGGETGWFRDTFAQTAAHAGYRFYPQYPELGLGQPAQPSLRPAFREFEASYQQDVTVTYNKGIKRMARDARSDGK